MEEKKGHTQEEVDKILGEAEEQKKKAEEANIPNISQEEAVKKINDLIDGARTENPEIWNDRTS